MTVAHHFAAERCRRVAARIRELADGAYPGPWTSDESDDCWRLHSAPDPHFPTAQILKAPKHGTPYAEYWPDKATGAHIVAWSPPPALAVAAFLEQAAADIDALPPTSPAEGLPPLLLAAARMAEAFELAQPSVPDDPEVLKRELAGLAAKVVARHGAVPGSKPRSSFWADLNRRLEDPEFRQGYIEASQRIQEFDARMNGEDLS